MILKWKNLGDPEYQNQFQAVIEMGFPNPVCASGWFCQARKKRGNYHAYRSPTLKDINYQSPDLQL